jgi:hypothetical protein
MLIAQRNGLQDGGAVICLSIHKSACPALERTGI